MSRLRLVVVLAALYLVAEVVGGWWTNSLALLADAGHMLSDVAALAISMAALRAAARAATPERTWGFHRAEALAALANGIFLAAASGAILWEAAHRLGAPPDVEAPLALAIATGGLVVNLAGLAILGHDHEHGMGVRSAWLHMLGDALGSAGAMASAACIWLAGWRWADPVASVLIAVLVLRSALMLLRETLGVLMEGTPAHLDAASIASDLAAVPGVQDVHDLHLWSITTGLEALSVHVVVAEGTAPRTVLADAHAMLRERHGLAHATVQVEEAGPEPAASPLREA